MLIDIGIGVTIALLPEIAPSVFGATATADGSLMLYPGATMGPAMASGTAANGMAMFTMAVDNPATQFSWSNAIATGAVLGGLPASAPNAPQTPQTRTPPTPQTPKKNCPPVPPHPQSADVDANIRATEAVNAADPTGNGAKAWWVNQVQTRGPWDYKTQGIAYDDFGNFNYGATGAVFTNSLSVLEGGAVAARLAARPWAQLKNYGLKNDPHKNDMIRQGMQYKQGNCGKF